MIGRSAVCAAALMSIAASQAMAGGFALKERSARAQGLSFAGASAGAGGISSMGFNPATLGQVAGREFQLGVALVSPKADGAVTVGGTPTGETVAGGKLGLVPNTYYAQRLNPRLVAGIAINAPFGLSTEYPATWTGAGDGINSDLLTIQISPTVAYEVTPALTVGAAINILYADATLTSTGIDLRGDDTRLGFALGALFEAGPSTQIGLAYQHGYDLTLVGTGQGPTTGGFVFPASADASLPATLSLGVVHAVSPQTRLMGELQWQDWSVFDAIDVTLTTPGGDVPQSDPQNYKDAFFLALGAEYDMSSKLTLRGGIAYDETPTVDSDFLTGGTTVGRSVRVPDGDRLWLSVGASYEVAANFTLDAGYSFLYGLEDPVVDLRTAPGTSVDYEGGAHILSLGGTWRF